MINLIMSFEDTDSLNLWCAAIDAFDEKNYKVSLNHLMQVSNPSDLLLYNTAILLIQLDRKEEAFEKLTEALEKNGYFVIAIFRRACIHFIEKRYTDAINDFEMCQQLFQNKHIDYNQMGLTSKLFLSEVEYNTGLCYLMNNNVTKGTQLLLKAEKDSNQRLATAIHQTLSALQKNDLEYHLNPLGLLIIPSANSLFRPNRASSSQKEIDFLSKAKVIASCSTKTTFSNEKIATGDNKTTNAVKNAIRSNNNSIPYPPEYPPPRKIPVNLTTSTDDHQQPSLNFEDRTPPAPDFPPPRKE